MFVLAALIAACGGGGSSSSSEPASESTTAESTPAGEETTEETEKGSEGGGGTALIAEAEEFLATEAPGANELPKSGPKPPKGLNVWVMPCDAAASGCEEVVTGVEEAGKVLGWNVTAFDGKSDPARWAEGFNQAVAAHADAMVTGAVDCAPIKSALQKAKSAGLITINFAGFDCPGEKLFTYTVEPAEGIDEWIHPAEVSGSLQAAWAIVHSEENVKAIQMTNNEQELTIGLGDGFKEYIKKCSKCEILEEVPFRLAELGSPLTQKASSAMLSNPEANFIDTPYDPAAEPAAQAVVAAGKTGSVQVLGAIGAPASIELIREERGQVMSVGWDDIWGAWAAMDAINRIENKEKPVYSGWALGLVDAENLPEGEKYESPADYKGNYEKIWTGK